jgi:hypothetical protein
VRPTACLSVLVLTGILAGCGGTRFMSESARITAPPEGKALVNFHRPSNYGGAADFPLYDRTTLIGNLKGKSVVQVPCDPGEHWFIGRADHVSVVQATLEAGQTYDIAVDVGIGVMQANIVLSPLNQGDKRRAEVVKWERSERPMTLTDHQDAAGFEQKHRKDTEEILADFQGAKKDRVKVMTAADHR